MRAERIPARHPTHLLWLLPVLLFVLPTFADELEVTRADGATKLRFDDAWQSPHVGMIVSLPAVVSTGPDGIVELRQGPTAISIAGNTAIELHADPASGNVLQRVVQDKGSAFYDIAPQGSKRFRVESPYLVAVVKGTEFNVTVTADMSTVALFEGHLQIDAPEIGDSVEIYSGEIARRHRDDARISILDMADGEIVRRSDIVLPPVDASRGDDSNVVAIRGDDGGPDDGTGGGAASSGDGAAGRPGTGKVPGLQADIDAAPGKSVSGGIELEAGGDAERLGVNAALAASLEIDAGGADVGVDFGLNAGGIAADASVDAGVDLGSATVDAGADLGLDVGGVSADAGVDAGVDLGNATVDAGADLGLDAGGVSADAGVDVGADLGGATADAGADLGLDAGGATADAGVDIGADLGNATVDAGADLGLDTGGATADAGVDAGADLGNATVDAGADLGLDAGGATADAGVEAGVDPGNATVDVGGSVDVAGTGVDAGVSADTGGVNVDLGLGGLDAGVGLDLGDNGLDPGDPGAEETAEPAPEESIVPDLRGLLGR